MAATVPVPSPMPAPPSPRTAALSIKARQWLPFYRDGFNRHQRAAVDLLMAHNLPTGPFDLEEAVETAASLLLQHKEA